MTKAGLPLDLRLSHRYLTTLTQSRMQHGRPQRTRGGYSLVIGLVDS